MQFLVLCSIMLYNNVALYNVDRTMLVSVKHRISVCVLLCAVAQLRIRKQGSAWSAILLLSFKN